VLGAARIAQQQLYNIRIAFTYHEIRNTRCEINLSLSS
jgi:hypothetical protein